jgi:hypothetical protein
MPVEPGRRNCRPNRRQLIYNDITWLDAGSIDNGWLLPVFGVKLPPEGT